MPGKPKKEHIARNILKNAGPRGMFISELARSAGIAPTSVQRYVENDWKGKVLVEKRGGLTFIYWTK